MDQSLNNKSSLDFLVHLLASAHRNEIKMWYKYQWDTTPNNVRNMKIGQHTVLLLTHLVPRNLQILQENAFLSISYKPDWSLVFVMQQKYKFAF